VTEKAQSRLDEILTEALERLDEIKDLGVIMDGKMSFLLYIEAIISKSSRMLGFIKRISRDFRDPYTHKTLYTSLFMPNLEHAACVWSPHQSVHFERLERVQHNFIRYAVRRMPWRVYSLPAYDAKCLLIVLEVLSDRRIVASAIFGRDILVDFPDVALMLRFEEVPYSRRRNAGLMTFFHSTNYGRFEPVNNAIINFNKYCHWFGFCSEVSCDMFRDRLKSALSGERFGHRRLQ
jgi:hypothetical protein